MAKLKAVFHIQMAGSTRTPKAEPVSCHAFTSSLVLFPKAYTGGRDLRASGAYPIGLGLNSWVGQLLTDDTPTRPGGSRGSIQTKV